MMREGIGVVAEMGEPARLGHHEVEMVAVDDEIRRPSAPSWMARSHDLDAAEMGAVIVAQELVVIAGHVDDSRALARLAQQLLDDVVVRLRPIPARSQLPAVDDVADEIDRLGIVVPQEVEQEISLATARAEMHVGDEEGAKRPHSVFWQVHASRCRCRPFMRVVLRLDDNEAGCDPMELS